ncbi:mitochondrial carrier [Kockovaella imperatae]|uniref:Mitochondrial carrier n=1 Tax=Kockovaella imperatae TaxID=4999 RepID=A0A1Y1U5J5_9TREE|nr:mitochondrial carrier [Kockovaella imperatae]ORX33298.1 mitochondrial carrier [Kockovaella imperatae]
MSDAATHAVAGAAGGCVSLAITYPLVNLSTRKAVKSEEGHDTIVASLKRIYAREGIAGLYSGLESSLLGMALTNGIYYASYERVRAIMLKRKEGALTTAQGITAGLIAGITTSMITNPIWTIQVAQSTRGKESIAVAAQRIYNEAGVLGFWRGIGPALVLVLNPVIQYTTFERLLALILTLRKSPTRSSLTSLDLFILGAASKLIATGSTYPIIVVKSRLQAATHKYKSSLHAILHILRKEGLHGLYAGLVPKLVQSVLTAAFMFVAQRRIYEMLRAI